MILFGLLKNVNIILIVLWIKMYFVGLDFLVFFVKFSDWYWLVIVCWLKLIFWRCVKLFLIFLINWRFWFLFLEIRLREKVIWIFEEKFERGLLLEVYFFLRFVFWKLVIKMFLSCLLSIVVVIIVILWLFLFWILIRILFRLL